MRRTGLLVIPLLGILGGCVPTTGGGPSAGGRSPQHSRLALPSGDPILKAIDFHLKTAKRGERDWALGPDLLAGEELPEGSATAPPAQGPAAPAVSQVPGATGPVEPVRAEPTAVLEAEKPSRFPPGPCRETPVESPDAYRIRAGDLADIAVSGHTELSGEVRVRQDGNIILPGAGIFARARGFTTLELAGNIALALHGDYLKAKPGVSVEILDGPEYVVVVLTADGQLIPVPASEAATLSSLVVRLGARLRVTTATRFRVTLPAEGRTLEVDGGALLGGRSPDLRLAPGTRVEVVEQPPAAAAERPPEVAREAEQPARERHRKPGWVFRKGEEGLW